MRLIGRERLSTAPTKKGQLALALVLKGEAAILAVAATVQPCAAWSIASIVIRAGMARALRRAGRKGVGGWGNRGRQAQGGECCKHQILHQDFSISSRARCPASMENQIDLRDDKDNPVQRH
jgi:hypothetical protein